MPDVRQHTLISVRIIRIAASLLLAASICALLALRIAISDAQNRRCALSTNLLIMQWATALEMYDIDHGRLPAAPRIVLSNTCSQASIGESSFDATFTSLVDAWPLSDSNELSDLRSFLTPAYLPATTPTTDAWGHPLLVGITSDFSGFTLMSVGSDGRIDRVHEAGSFDMSEPHHDVVFSGSRTASAFVSFPSGIARR